MCHTPHSPFQQRQQGGLTIIMALILVSVMGAATFGLSRNVVRELSMGGTMIQGEKAAAAADAGLDWVIIWGQGHVNNKAYTDATPATGQKTLVDGINSAMSGVNIGDPIPISGDTDLAMTMNNGSTTNARQTFDVELRYLGTGWGNSSIGGTGGSSDNNAASGGTKGNNSSSTPVGWRILSTGKSTPSGTTQTYTSQREVIATFPF
jgi:hypothetical protein